jgi:DNA-binding Lrp family transcriptional regulator
MQDDASPIELDSTDYEILKALQIDSKTQYRELAEKTGRSLGTIANRINKLQDYEIIKKWTVMIDAEKVGYDLTVVINIQIDPNYLDEINKELTRVEELIALYNVTGEWDIIAIGRFRNRRHLDKVIKQLVKIQDIKRTSSNVALRTLKEDFRVNIDRIRN